MIRRVMFVGLAASLVVAGSSLALADAQRWTFNDLSSEQIEDVLDRAADVLTYEQSVDGVGRPMWQIEHVDTGLRFRLYVYDDESEDPEDYESLLARAGFAMPTPPTVWTVNGFNQSKRFARAFLNEDGDPIIESDLDLFGGVTEDAILRFVLRFAVTLNEFASYIGYR